MKVVCGSCGAKYSVADDKVAGKTVKIRCKKCSEVIVVHGEQQNPFEEDEATRVFDYGGEAVWHVVVNGEQQGPFAPLQIGALLMEGKVDAEAYVWKEGFDGWKALRDIPELASLATKGGDAPQVEADLESDGGDLFGSGAAKPAAAAAASSGGDLFASSSKGGFGGGDDDDGVVASSPGSPRVSSQQASMTGQRNENSVLFSLSNLQALATGPSSGGSSSASSSSSGSSPSPFASSASSSGSTPAASKPAGHAVGEASGLIDIRALASATSAVGAAKASSAPNVDDLLSIGAGPSPLASPLAAPVFAPISAKKEEEPKKSNTGLIVGLGAVGVALIGAVGFLGYKVMNATPSERIVERVIVQGGGDDDNNGNSGSNANDAPAAGGSDAPAAAAAGTTGSASGSTRPAHSTGTTGTTSNTAAATPTAAMTTTAPTMTEAPAASGSTTDAMRRLLAMGGTTAPAPTAPAMTEAPAMTDAPAATGGPNRAEIGAALGGLRGAVSACGDGVTHGVASVRVTFAPNGSVSAASVGGDFAGTPAAGCISRAVRGAHISSFDGAPTAVTYPYRL